MASIKTIVSRARPTCKTRNSPYRLTSTSFPLDQHGFSRLALDLRSASDCLWLDIQLELEMNFNGTLTTNTSCFCTTITTILSAFASSSCPAASPSCPAASPPRHLFSFRRVPPMCSLSFRGCLLIWHINLFGVCLERDKSLSSLLYSIFPSLVYHSVSISSVYCHVFSLRLSPLSIVYGQLLPCEIL